MYQAESLKVETWPYSEIYLQQLYMIPTMNIGEKILYSSSGNQGKKGTIFTYSRASYA